MNQILIYEIAPDRLDRLLTDAAVAAVLQSYPEAVTAADQVQIINQTCSRLRAELVN